MNDGAGWADVSGETHSDFGALGHENLNNPGGAVSDSYW
jgi:hypothetical protein